jgi:hypothetical protein
VEGACGVFVSGPPMAEVAALAQQSRIQDSGTTPPPAGEQAQPGLSRAKPQWFRVT